MNSARCVLVYVQTFEKQVVALRFVQIDQWVSPAASFENIRIRRFADLAFECLPVIRAEMSALFFMSSSFEPSFETVVVNVLNSSATLTRREERVLDCGFVRPAESTVGYLLVKVKIY